MASSIMHHSLIKSKKSTTPSTATAARTPAPIILLRMCDNLREIEQLHARLVLSGLIRRGINAGRLIESYVSIRQIHLALSVFRTIPSPDIFAYNTIIRGLTSDNRPSCSLSLYRELLLGGLTPDNYTHTFVLKACSNLKSLSEGEQVHGQIIKAGIEPETHIHSSLIHMYANSGCLDSAEQVLAEFSEENVLAKNSMITGYMNQGCVGAARQVFDEMPTRDSASWSALITGYVKNGCYGEALVIVREMIASRVPVNESTLVNALSACGHLGALEQGRWIHVYAGRIGAKLSVTLGTSLVDMYAKCGCIGFGYEVFESMPEKDVVAWGAIIAGFAMHGDAAKCFELFETMIRDGTQPNEVIFVGILTACRHVGFVELGLHYFDLMVRSYGIRPTIEHFGCMVDLLGRAGRLEEAEELISSMSEEPNAIVWGALLGACRIHKDLRRGERAFKKLSELEPVSGDRYKLISHLLIDTGEQEGVNKLRKEAREYFSETTCGSSFIEVNGMVHEFVAGDIDHSRSLDIYRVLQG